MVRKTNPKQKKVTLHFEIDCSMPVKDGIMEPASFEKFLKEKIKVNGKAGVLGDNVTVARNNTKITVDAVAPFSKRYLKYLTKKFLKKYNLRDYIRVVATNKSSYELKYFVIQDDEDDAE
eukprot:CAMPEP_0117038088 /NCGR_PEP_ID=MMETSP0472-20121206/26832_1 /TAXON_ID=693140 ORGANISM="Tiarina fusus, Strain LIS" /NCGR_SAMPLE_ID=MMETSP0472 /ASSEMBLY_ACC=CAM_ASM_000603 /LENGTH=119 /DNA_ID=CAMNT_0004748235 /DNA_START=35 /DNA_END=394 /DNA_ORIENTATION=-